MSHVLSIERVNPSAELIFDDLLGKPGVVHSHVYILFSLLLGLLLHLLCLDLFLL